MRVKKTVKNATNRRPEVRNLKIQPHFRKNKYNYVKVAEIRLCGHWLEKLGFCQDQRVQVTAMKNLIIVRPIQENSV
ncbi:MAG: type I addiction module toxin, SymE family [Terrimonas sp.]|nr:type I addiction module toxin, SymE family [Terrimonas sp.]